MQNDSRWSARRLDVRYCKLQPVELISEKTIKKHLSSPFLRVMTGLMLNKTFILSV